MYLTNLIGSVGTSLLLVTTFILFIVLSFKITNKSISAFFKKIIPKKDDLETNTIKEKNTIEEPTEDLSNEKNEILKITRLIHHFKLMRCLKKIFLTRKLILKILS